MAATTANAEADADSKEDVGPPSKRRRVALACNACRIRKSRCNGERPKCALCTNLGFDCTYEPTDSSTNVIVRKEYVSDVESRLKIVEDLLRRHDDLLHGHLSACRPDTTLSPNNAPSSIPNKPTPVQSEALTRSSIQLEAAELQQEQITEEHLTDGMALSFVDETQSAFFGPSSNITFTRHILRAMSRSIAQPKLPRANGGGLNGGMLGYSRAASPNSPQEPGKSMLQSYALQLPSVAEMESHISAFFRNTGILFPFIHEPTFMATYNMFKDSNFTKVRRTWLGLLNMVMAMGSTWLWGVAEDAVARSEISNQFFERAVALAAKPSVRSVSIDTIQYLLLASQYLQGTQKSSQTWTLHGIAVKGAFSLGLHSNQASQHLSPLENEIRKRTWFGCILLDRVLSMTFGRPLSIHEDLIHTSLAEPWPDLTPDFPSYDLQKPAMDFFNASVSLHRLMGKTITCLYGNNLGYDVFHTESEFFPRIFEMEHDLQHWEYRLPHNLQIVRTPNLPSATSDYERVVGRFRTMLSLRYLNLQILVQRPPLCRALDQLSNITTTCQISLSDSAKRSIDKCMSSAEETIHIIHDILTSSSNLALCWSLLGAWWFSLYYLFSAALVIFSHSIVRTAIAQQGLVVPLQSRREIQHMTKALVAFRLLDRNNHIVDRSTDYVESLLKIMERQAAADGERPTTDPSLDVPQEPQGTALAGEFDGTNALPDLSEFLNTDMEVAQFFASGIFDVQTSLDGFMAGFQ